MVRRDPNIFYHVTPVSNLQSIRHDGLVPQIGPRAIVLGEKRPMVFLFRNMDDVENAISNWLGEELEDAGELALVEVTLPIEMRRKRVAFETQVFDTIPPRFLRVESEDYGA